MADFWADAFLPTSLGTGVTTTTLNGGNDYNVSAKAHALIEVVPEVVTTGAFTAGQSFMIRLEASSDDVPSINPKTLAGSFGLGGLGSFDFAGYPMLKAKTFNSRMPGATTNVRFTGTPQIANTVAPEMALTVFLSNGAPLGEEQFYIAPTNETSTGTTAGEVAGGDITINGGRMINLLSVVLTTGVITASESTHGRGQLSSTNFFNVPTPQRWHAQPIAAGLGSAVSVLTPGDSWFKVGLPIGNSFLGNTALLLDEDLTAAGNFIVQAGYLKRMGA